jgi:hypothetical protein
MSEPWQEFLKASDAAGQDASLVYVRNRTLARMARVPADDLDRLVQRRELEAEMVGILNTLPLWQQEVVAYIGETSAGFQDLPRAAVEVQETIFRFIPAPFIVKVAERALEQLREPDRAQFLAPYQNLVAGRRVPALLT